MVIITGHIDSRVTDPMDFTKDAPGANDDGSGTAAVIEAARVLSKHKFPYTIVYAALSGEEQGLLGGKILADYARAQGWEVIANLNNDIIGNSCGSDGVCDDAHVRVFSEGPRWQGHEDLAARIRSLGGENDAPSRNLSRWLDGLADDLGLGLDVRRSGATTASAAAATIPSFSTPAIPAVRITVAIENYNWQHQDLRVENGVEYGDTIDKMDFPYLTQGREAERRGAGRARQRAAAAGADGGRGGFDRHDAQLEARCAAPTPMSSAGGGPTRPIGRRAFGSRRAPISSRPRFPAHPGPVRSSTIATRPSCPACGSTIMCSECRRCRRTAMKAPVASAVPGGAFQPYSPPPPPAP